MHKDSDVPVAGELYHIIYKENDITGSERPHYYWNHDVNHGNNFIISNRFDTKRILMYLSRDVHGDTDTHLALYQNKIVYFRNAIGTVFSKVSY